MNKLLLTTLALAFASTYSFGQTVLSDTFSYPDGSLVENTGSPWVSTPPISTTGQVDVSGGKVNLTRLETEDVNAPLAQYTSGLLVATFKVLFTELPSAVGSYFAHFKDEQTGATSNFQGRVTAATNGAATGSFRLGISNTTSTATFLQQDLALGTEYTLTLTLDLNTYISSLSINGGSAVAGTDATRAILPTAFALRQSTGIGTLTFDDLNVVAVPEPSTLGLMGVGLLLGVVRRRR